MLPPDVVSLDEAHAAIELWEHYKRRKLDPPQRLAVEVMMATNGQGLWAATTTGREMPRQNGKGDEIEVVELWGLLQRAERILHTVHDAVLLATETQSRLLSVLEHHPDLRQKIGRVWRGTGQQMIEMRNGGIVWYRTRTGGGGRGVDEVDRIIVDEAQHAEEEHLAAITPTLLASVNPQLNALGTAAIAGKSVWWWRQRRRALGSDPGSFGYVGHTAERVSLNAKGEIERISIDVTDRALWRAANPALASGRVGEAFFADQLGRLGPDLFAREHLGVWDSEPGQPGAVIPLAAWEALVDRTSAIAARTALGVDVAPDGLSASIVAVGRRADGLPHVETVDARPGTHWLGARLAELIAGNVAEVVAVNGAGPAGAMLPDLERACGSMELKQINGREYAAACEAFLVAVTEDRLRHLGDILLAPAVTGAARRSVGEGWVWDRKHKATDITPLVAATVALRALEQLAESSYAGSFIDLDDY